MREAIAGVPFLVGPLILPDFLKRPVKLRLQIVHGLVDVGIVAGARGIHDVLVPRQHFLDIAGQHAAGAEQVDLEHERVPPIVLVEQMLQRRVGDDAAVPEMIGADTHHLQRRQQRAAGHHMFGLDHFLLVVEIEEVAGQHIDRADREVDVGLIDQVEIDELQEGLARRRGVVAVLAPAGLSHGLSSCGLKKPRPCGASSRPIIFSPTSRCAAWSTTATKRLTIWLLRPSNGAWRVRFRPQRPRAATSPGPGPCVPNR
jgi:hypothetical protein